MGGHGECPLPNKWPRVPSSAPRLMFTPAAEEGQGLLLSLPHSWAWEQSVPGLPHPSHGPTQDAPLPSSHRRSGRPRTDPKNELGRGSKRALRAPETKAGPGWYGRGQGAALTRIGVTGAPGLRLWEGGNRARKMAPCRERRRSSPPPAHYTDGAERSLPQSPRPEADTAPPQPRTPGAPATPARDSVG